MTLCPYLELVGAMQVAGDRKRLLGSGDAKGTAHVALPACSHPLRHDCLG